MDNKRNYILSAVYLLLCDGDKVLFLKRANGWMDGFYSLPAGHLDGNETVPQAMLREAYEEIGIEIKESDLKIIHTMHRLADKEYIDFFLTTEKWIGNPINKESNKCSCIQWFSLNSLPDNVVPHVRHFLESVVQNKTFSESVD